VHFLAENPRPEMIIFHGFRRSPDHLASWRKRFPAAAFGCLPGHGGAPRLDQVSVRGWAEAWAEALVRIEVSPVLVGESLGAMVSMCLPARAVIAVEPLLGVEQIWPQHEVMARARARGLDFTEAEYGLFEHPYDWVLDRIGAPTLVIAGLTPLLPRRALSGFAPSLLTDEDFERYASHPLVTARRIPGGHTLMDENPQGVSELIDRFLGPDIRRFQSTS
jgi:pimeloyl-ACP methyl ester carboxylesterase